MEKEELSKILEDHKLWAETRASEEKKGCRAYLQGANLSGADLRDTYLGGADLQGANLSGADLQYTNLSCAYLHGADLGGADLRGAYLHDTNLSRADLRGADLRDANLSHAYLYGAYLHDTNLGGADLRGADLQGAYLSGAYLHDTNLSRADLRDANLRGADLDFSCLPLWCGSLRANMDDRQIKQLLYHALSIVVNSSNVSDELKKQLLTNENLMVANEFHRVGECQVLKKQEVMEKDAKNERWKDERKNNGTGYL